MHGSSDTGYHQNVENDFWAGRLNFLSEGGAQLVASAQRLGFRVWGFVKCHDMPRSGNTPPDGVFSLVRFLLQSFDSGTMGREGTNSPTRTAALI